MPRSGPVRPKKCQLGIRFPYPLLSNVYMRRFVLGWKTLGYAQHFCAEIVNFADDLCVLGKAPAAEMLTAVERLMGGLKLTVNEQKTRCLRCPEEPIEFLGYRIGRNYRPHGKGAYYRHPPQQGERPEHMPQDQRDDGATAWREVNGSDGGRPEPHHERVGKLLQPRPSQPGLQRGQPPHGKAATPVARSKAQDAGGEIRAILRREAVRRLQPPASHAANRGLSEREGMISSESRMRAIRTSRLMSGGLETGPRETD